MAFANVGDNNQFDSNEVWTCKEIHSDYKKCVSNDFVCAEFKNDYIERGIEVCNQPTTQDEYAFFLKEKEGGNDDEQNNQMQRASIIPEEADGTDKDEDAQVNESPGETQPVVENEDQYNQTDEQPVDEYGYYNDDPPEDYYEDEITPTYGSLRGGGGASDMVGGMRGGGSVNTNVGIRTGSRGDLNVRVQGVANEITRAARGLGERVEGAATLAQPMAPRQVPQYENPKNNGTGGVGAGTPPMGGGQMPQPAALDNNLNLGGSGGRRRGGRVSAFADEISKRRGQTYMGGSSPNVAAPAANTVANKRRQKAQPPKYRKKTDHALALLARHQNYQNKNYYDHFGRGSKITEYNGQTCLDTVFCNMETFFTDKVERLPTSEINPDSFR